MDDAAKIEDAVRRHYAQAAQTASAASASSNRPSCCSATVKVIRHVAHDLLHAALRVAAERRDREPHRDHLRGPPSSRRFAARRTCMGMSRGRGAWRVCVGSRARGRGGRVR